MTPQEFKKLKSLLRPIIQKHPVGRKALTVGHQLAITLRFLSSGDSIRSISFAFRVGFSTTHTIVTKTAAAIWLVLSPIYLPSPTAEIWGKNERAFAEKWNYPNCIGAVDGKHIAIKAPSNSGTLYFNYKHHFSIVLMAVVDADYKFVVVDVGSFGSNSDGGIWKNSSFGRTFDAGKAQIPKPKCLPFSDSPLPHVLVGDEAFQLRKNFMRPFPGRSLPDDERIYNYRHSRARRCSENAFGIMVSRWRVLKSPIEMQPKNCDTVIKACVVLHNYLMAEGEGRRSLYCPRTYADRILANGRAVNGGWRLEETNVDASLLAHNTEDYSLEANEIQDLLQC